MSLLNDVLRDLQSRGASEADPLSGLAPVALAQPRAHRRTRVVVLLGVVTAAAGILFWQPVTSDADSAPVAWAPATLPMTVQQPHAGETVAATRAGIETPIPDDMPRRADPVPAAASAPGVLAQPEPAPQAAVPRQADAPPRSEAALHADAQPQPAAPPTTMIVRRDSDATGGVADGLIERGLRAMRARNYSAAEQFFRSAVAADAGDTTAWRYLYGAQSAAPNPGAAEQTLRHALASAREPAAIAKLYARLLIDRGETGAAIRLLQEYRPPAASDTELDAFLAALLQQQGRFAEAGEIYSKLLEADQRPGAWWVGLALSSDSLGDSAAALAAFQRALLADALEPSLARYARRRIAELQANG